MDFGTGTFILKNKQGRDRADTCRQQAEQALLVTVSYIIIPFLKIHSDYKIQTFIHYSYIIHYSVLLCLCYCPPSHCGDIIVGDWAHCLYACLPAPCYACLHSLYFCLLGGTSVLCRLPPRHVFLPAASVRRVAFPGVSPRGEPEGSIYLLPPVVEGMAMAWPRCGGGRQPCGLAGRQTWQLTSLSSLHLISIIPHLGLPGGSGRDLGDQGEGDSDSCGLTGLAAHAAGQTCLSPSPFLQSLSLFTCLPHLPSLPLPQPPALLPCPSLCPQHAATALCPQSQTFTVAFPNLPLSV